MNLKQKYGNWALITGASSGIGMEFARKFAGEGIDLILVARRKERLEALAAELEKENNINVITAPIDLSKDNFLEKLVDQIGDRQVDILVNNAGFGSNGLFITRDSAHETAMIKVNCIAPTVLTHHFAPLMTARRKGAIIFLGSVVAFQPTPFMATYAATKAFNLLLGEALWYELKQNNVEVLTLNPGGTATEFQRIADSSTGPVPRTTEQVVNTAMKALGKKISVVDGLYNKALTFLPRFGSRKLVVNGAGIITKTLYRKKKIGKS